MRSSLVCRDASRPQERAKRTSDCGGLCRLLRRAQQTAALLRGPSRHGSGKAAGLRSDHQPLARSKYPPLFSKENPPQSKPALS
ncbi:hypothetical protein PtA15_6A26 [Puccinia triticina]|uniref:Uncharacterized protein n=1 Tax=Puccinia triticina TaxID=208348 RepID=A0ABY7CKF7_9BASI|nr:uncharacterized protein PtA15_6A26 [Puccinia triticina]WAQ85398.1 hypothetical protein PtA15_6A26 [Puccinia triticina]